MAAAAALAHVLSAAVALAACVTTAVVASRWLPIGAARRVDPDLGMRLDAAIVLPGAVLVAGLLLASTFATGWLAGRRPGAPGVGERRGLLEWVRRHASPSVGIGTTLALRTGRGRNAVAVRPALLGAIVGVLGVAAALTLGAGLQSALDHPERAGSVWDAAVEPPEDPAIVLPTAFRQDFVDAVTGVDEVADVAQIDRSVMQVDQVTGLPTYCVRSIDGRRRSPIS